MAENRRRKKEIGQLPLDEKAVPREIEEIWQKLSDRYVFDTYISQGKNGVTYKILQRNTNKAFCLKTVLPTAPNPVRSKDSLVKEIDFLLPLSHRCLPHIYEFSKKKEMPFYVATYHPGNTLLKHLEGGGQTPPHYNLGDSLLIISTLLDVLEYMHTFSSAGKGRTHCDLHPNNIMISSDLHKDGLMIIDFGSGHIEGDTTPVTENRGAQQFKMHDHAQEHGLKVDKTDPEVRQGFRQTDYYAIGSLLNKFKDQFFCDISPLQRQYLEELVESLQHSTTIAAAKEKLSEVAEPFAELSKILKEFETGRGQRMAIRLPIDREIEVGDVHLEFINSKYVQRLRLLRQLSFCEWYFPGANHTRFEHTLGVFNKVFRAIKYLSQDRNFRRTYSAEELRACMISGLLHDIGHYPFAHAIEQYALSRYPERDDIKEAVSHTVRSLHLLDSDKHLNSCIKNYAGEGAVDLMKQIIGKPPSPNVLSDLLNGPIDCDKLDYLQRDAWHCGVGFGLNSSDQTILSNYRYIQGRLGISQAAVPHFEGFAILQDQMLTSVYWHQYVRSVHAMFHHALDLITGEDPAKFKKLVEEIKNCKNESEALTKAIQAKSNPSSEDIVTRLIGLHYNPSFADIYKCICIYQRTSAKIGGRIYQFVIQPPATDGSHPMVNLSAAQVVREGFVDAITKEGIAVEAGHVLVDIPVGKTSHQDFLVDTDDGPIKFSEMSHIQLSLFKNPTIFNSPIRVFLAPEIEAQLLAIDKERMKGIIEDAHSKIKIKIFRGK